jgi:bifunctional non-homologous end joining protein LigD
MEYGQYEGIIPEGYYGAGPVLIWDSGTYDPLHIDLSGGKLEFVLHGNELRGAFVMMRLKDKDRQWLLIKKRDRYALDSYQTKPLMTEKTYRGFAKRFPHVTLKSNKT